METLAAVFATVVVGVMMLAFAVGNQDDLDRLVGWCRARWRPRR